MPDSTDLSSTHAADSAEASTASSPSTCDDCKTSLCLRQQTINLALGNDEQMYCLPCLAKQSECSPLDLLTKTKGYVLSRQCFRKEWVKYPDRSSCPQPATCMPDACFAP